MHLRCKHKTLPSADKEMGKTCVSSPRIMAFSHPVDFGDFLELQCIPWALQVGFSFLWIPRCLAVIEGTGVGSPPTGGAKVSCYS